MKKNVAITIIDLGYDYSDEISRLAQLGFRAEYIPLEGTNDIDRIANALSGFQYAMIGPELWSAETFDRLPEIRMLARLGAGVDQIDLNAASKHGVPVCNTPGANACSVAQYALTFMLCLATKTARYDRSIRQGVVTRSMTGDLIGKTVGLVGFGNVGRQLALLLTGFGVRLLICDIVRDEAAAKEFGAEYVSLDELTASSDFISLHMPLTPKTRGMIDAHFFSRMKPGAFLINTSRGGVLNEGALIAALLNGTIAGAGLDVFERSPLPQDSPLLHMDNVVLTPYVAYSSKLGNSRTMQMAIASLNAYANGDDTPPHLLNPEYLHYRTGRFRS